MKNTNGLIDQVWLLTEFKTHWSQSMQQAALILKLQGDALFSYDSQVSSVSSFCFELSQLSIYNWLHKNFFKSKEGIS